MLDRGYAGSCIRTSENASYRQLVNKDMKKGRGLRRPRPGVGSQGRSVRLFPHVAVVIIGRGLLAPWELPIGFSCALLCSRANSSAVSLSPACSLAAHSPAGMVVWMNAIAGAVIMPSSITEVTAVASTFFILLKIESLLSCPLPVDSRLYGL